MAHTWKFFKHHVRSWDTTIEKKFEASACLIGASRAQVVVQGEIINATWNFYGDEISRLPSCVWEQLSIQVSAWYYTPYLKQARKAQTRYARFGYPKMLFVQCGCLEAPSGLFNMNNK